MNVAVALDNEVGVGIANVRRKCTVLPVGLCPCVCILYSMVLRVGYINAMPKRQAC